MTGRISRGFIDELLVRVDIVDLIDSRVPLKKTGSNYVARCPFHTEKSPSFSVNRNKQFFHCFGCGASGNAISFLMDFGHLSFVEAVEDLAAFAGVAVQMELAGKEQAKPVEQSLKSLYLLMEQVAGYYVDELRKNASAVNYLKSRQVKGEVARDFLLGYAPDKWDGLASQFDQNLLIEAGMLVVKDDGKVYDRFRNRIMYPIRDKRSRIVGFGGRVLDDSLPKYLNSPETPLFHKGKEVYGLYELLAKNPKPQRILIVEGYMDVIALTQYGINYSVAALGTAASQAHLDLLFRFTSELVFCFDGDKAGREAAWKVMDAMFSSLKDGRSCRIMLLPEQHDPDSLVRAEGVDGFIDRVTGAQVLSDYFYEHVSRGLNLNEMEAKAQLVAKVKPYIEKLQASTFKELMVARLKELSGVKQVDALENSQFNRVLSNRKSIGQEINRLSSSRVAIALLLQKPELAYLVEKLEIDWAGIEFRGVDLFKGIQRLILENKVLNSAVLLEYYRDLPEEKTVKALAVLDLHVEEDKIDDVFSDALTGLLKQAREVAIMRLQVKAQKEGLNNEEQALLVGMLVGK